MKTIEGHDVKIFTDNIENTALEQIGRLMSIGTFSGCKVRIMPDVHAGAGCVIGFTGDLGDKVIPNIVGVDIGCGMLVQPFDCSGEIDFHALNEFILNNIPSGRGALYGKVRGSQGTDQGPALLPRPEGQQAAVQGRRFQTSCAGSKVSPGKTICTTCACVRNGPGSTAASS